MSLGAVLVVTGLLGAAFAGPIAWDDSQCSSHCSSGNHKFQYETGKTYVYSYQSQTQMGMTEDDGEGVQQGTMAEIRAKVEIHVQSKCEMILKLRDVTLSGTGHDLSFKNALEANLLPFSFDDGNIRELCPAPTDLAKPFVLNTKRAILSTIKNTMDNLEHKKEVKEVDIAGECTTKYVPVKGWSSVTVTKTKDLTSCKQRHNSPVAVFGRPYIVENSMIQNAPLLVGKLECEQVIGSGIVKNVECKERNVFSPLSRSGKGAAIDTKVNMVLKDTKDGITTKDMQISKKTNLLFSSGWVSAEAADESQVRQVLQKICEASREGIRPNLPFLVAKLIAVLRPQPYENVARIYEALDKNQICPSPIVQDMFVDALSMAGTEGPVKFMAKLAKEQKLSSARQLAWLTSLAFNTRVNEGVIRAMLPLLKDYSIGGRQTLLSVSSMIYSFCANNTEDESDCEDLPVIKEVVAALQKQIGNKCKASDREEEHRIRETLAAFENMGRTGDAADLLTECFVANSNSAEIRHSAILAFRRAPCEEKVTKKMLELYQNKNEEAHIRIYAYRGAMRCANKEVIKSVIHTLEKEDVVQVGSYVLSHLSNMQETSSPLKQDIRKVVADASLNHKFPSDPRKYSQYIELSSFSERLNVGGELEMSIVRSPKTFLPKSAMANITTYALGSEINLFEVGVEMDGLTHLLEKYFGVDGYFSKLSMDDLLEKIGMSKKEHNEENEVREEEEEDEKRRVARETKSGLSRINLLHERMNVVTPNDPKVSAHLSVLGRKIAMLYATDIKSFFELKEAFSIMEVLTELAQKQKVERSVSFQLVDTEVTVPSFSGMQIRLAVNATAVAAIQAEGKFDIRKLLTSERSADIDGHFNPSAAVEVSAIMSVDSGVHQSSLKIIGNAHTSQHIEGKVMIKDGRIISVKVNMPKEKVEFLTLKSEVFTVEANGQEKPLTPASVHEVDTCTGIFDRPLGVEFCAHAKFPKPFYNKNAPLLPIGGPMMMAISLKKTDKSMRGYSFQLELPGEHDYNEMVYKAEFDTPASRIDRHYALEAHLNRQSEEQTLNFKLTSPIKKLAGTASLVTRRELKKARMSVTLDEKDTYVVQGELKSTMASGKTELIPSIEISFPRNEPIVLKGSVAFTAGRKEQLVIDIQANRPLDHPSYLRGTIVKEGDFTTRNLDGRLKISTDLTLSTPFLEARLHGTGDKQDTVYSTDLSLNYKLPRKSQHTAKFTSKIQNLSTRYLTKFSTKTEATFSEYPEANTLVAWEFLHKPKEHLENDFKIMNGEHYQTEDGQFLHILQVSKIQGLEHRGRKGETENRLVLDLPFLKNEVDLKVTTKWSIIDKPSFNFDADLKYQDDKHIQAALNYNYINSKPMEMEIEAKLSTPKHEFIYQDKVKERSPNEYEGKTMVQWARGKRANIDYTYKIKTDSSKMHHEVDVRLKSPFSKIPMQQKALLRVTRDSIDIRSHTQYEGRPVYKIDAKLTRSGQSKIEVQAFGLEGELEVHNDDKSKSAKFDIKNKDNTLHYVASTEYTWERNKKAIEVQATWNIEKDPSNQLKLNAVFNKDSPRYRVDIRGRYGNDANLKIQGEVENELFSGTHDLSFDLNAPSVRPVTITFHHEMEDETARCLFRYLRNNVEQLEISTHGKFHLTKNMEIDAGVALKSPEHWLDGKEISVTFKHEYKTENYLANIRAQHSATKPYTLNLEYTTDAERSHKKVRAHATLTTPYPKYGSQEALVIVDLSRNTVQVSTDFTNAQNKQLKSAILLKGSTTKGSGNFQLETPFHVLKSMKMGMEVDNSDAFNTQVFLDVNKDRKLEWNSKFEYSGRDTVDSTITVLSAIGPKYDFNAHLHLDSNKKNLDMGMKREDSEVMASNFLWEKQNRNYRGRMHLKNNDWTWTVDAKNERKSGKEQIYSLSSRGIGKPIAITFTWKEEGKEITPELTICPSFRGSDCLTIEGRYKNDDSSSYILHREVGLKVRDQPGQEITASYLLSFQKNSFEHKVDVEIWGKELGYEAKYEEGEKDIVHLKLKLPSREMHALFNWQEVQDTLKMHAEFLADAQRQPSSKLSIDSSHKYTSQRDGIVTVSQITINHPQLDSPIHVTVEAEFHEGKVIRPLNVKAEVDYSSDSNKKLMAEFYIEKPNKDSSNVTLSFNIHQADRDALELAIQGHLGSGEDRTSTGSQWKFVKSGKTWKGFQYFELDQRDKEVHYYYRCPTNKYEAHATWKFTPGKVFELDTNYRANDDESSAKMVIDIPKPCVEITTFSEPGIPSVRYHMCVDSDNKQLLSITAETYIDNEKITDGNIVFDRRDEKTFSAHIHWRPEKVGDLMYKLMELSDKMESSSGIKEPLKSFWTSIRSVAHAFQDSILEPVIESVITEVEVIFKELSNDFLHVVKVVKRIYNQMPEFEEAIAPYTKVVTDTVEDLQQYVDDITPASLKEFAENTVQNIKDQASKMCSSGSLCFNIHYAYQRKGFEGIGEYFYSVFENMPEGYYKLLLTTKDLIFENIEMPSLDWQPLVEAFKSLGAWTAEQLEPIFNSETVKIFKEKLHEYQEAFKTHWNDYVHEVQEAFDERFKKLMNWPEIKIVIDILKEIKHEIEKEIKKLNLQKTADKIQSFAEEFLNPEALSNSYRVVTMDPENGKIEVELHLSKSPQEVKTLLMAANPFAAEPVEHDDDEDEYGITEKLTQVQSALKQEWIPPFKAHAQLVGGQHYVTFDSTFYDFAGECSYLLARDFADGNFSVVVKYEGQGNKGTGSIDKSIIVVAGDKIIEIDPDESTVQVNDQDVELPYIHGPVTVVRRGSTIVIDYKRGLSVTCHLVHDYCTTAISGWYYGKTAGLFGTYDHEPANDLMRPRGQMAQNQNNFARSWEVSTGCRYRTLINQEVEINPEDEKYDICRRYFKDSSSPLKPCFQELKREEYMKMCMRQVSIQRSPSEAMCTVAAAFAHVCRQKHIPVSLPSQCLKCQSKGGDDLEFGAKRRIHHSQPQSADVVFIVEEHHCNRAIVKDIESITRLIERDLVDSDLTGNRYGVVAFGGLREEKDAHSHTARGKLFFEPKDIVLATEKMTFKPEGRHAGVDTFGAIKAAIRYPFRTGVSKNFILLTCSPCNEDSMTVSYSDIQTLLLQRGITLHTLSERNIKLRKSSSKGKSIYGLDAHTVYRGKDVSQKTLEGTPDLRAQVSIPKDVCIALSQEVGGSFFSTLPYSEGQSSEAKNWKSLLARRVALTAEPHQCQDCDCAANEDDVAAAVCSPCRIPSPKRPTYADVSDEDEEF